METPGEFNLEEAIDKWEKANFAQKELTHSDTKELRSHIFETIDELVKTGLSEEEAFVVTQMRFGNRTDWGKEMETLNEDNFNLKKVVLLFSGVIFFIFSYHLILCINRLLVLWLNHTNGDLAANVEKSKVFFINILLFSVFAIVALYFMHHSVKWLFERISLKTTWIVVLIISLVFVVIAERYLNPLMRNSIKEAYLVRDFFVTEKYFEYVFFIIVIIGYALIFRHYNRK